MIEKLTSNFKPVGVTEVEQSQKDPVSKESSQTTSSSSVIQESKLAYARLGESAFSSSMQRAKLDAALNVSPGTAPETSSAVGRTTAPGAGETAGAEKVYKLGDKGFEVEMFQNSLNHWRLENGLPEISASGVFTKETEDAVKEFQRLRNLKDDGIANENTRTLLHLETTHYFKHLDSEVKDTIRNAYSALQNNPAGRDNLLKVIEKREFCYLISPDAQKAAIHGLMQDPSNKEMPDAINRMTLDAAILEKKTTYQSLSDEIKQQVMNTMFFKVANGGLDTAGDRYNCLCNLVADPEFGKRPLSQQKQMIETVSANRDSFTGYHLTRVLHNPNFQALDAAMQAKVIEIAHNNTMYANTKDQWPEMNDVDRLDKLLLSTKFQEASDEEKKAMLEAERKQIAYALGEK